MYSPTFERPKFHNLMLYLAHMSREDPHFGAVKLNKMMYYADFIAFFRLGKPITGAKYQKLSEGPAPRELLRERNYLIDVGDAVLEHRPYFRYVQQRLVPIACDWSRWTDEFSDEEMQIISEVLDAMKSMTAREASEASHREVGWILALEKEVIPYDTAVLVPEGDVESDAMFEIDGGNR